MWPFSSGVRFDPDKDIPSLAGKVILVTGGNIGLGKATIDVLAQHQPAAIWLAARNADKAHAAIADVQKQLQAKQPSSSSSSPPPALHFVQLDLSSFASIRQAARTVCAATDRLDVLMLNAGTMATPPGVTADGYELQFGTNHVGHALLTKLLLPTLLRTAALPAADVRVVVVSSAAHWLAPSGGLRLDAVKTPDCGGMHTWRRYSQSKLANILFARQLALEYPQIKAVSLHPGLVNTNIINGTSPLYHLIFKPFIPLLAKTPIQGAATQLWAATAPEGVVSGQYYHPVGVTGQDNAYAKDLALAKTLWDWTKEQFADVVD